MGSQVGFYAIGDDWIELLQLAESCGLKAVPEIKPRGPEVKPSFPLSLVQEQNFFYLMPSQLAPVELVYEPFFDNPKLLKLNPLLSPVIELTPCPFNDGKVSNGRIYMNLESEDTFYGLIRKSYNKLARHIKKWSGKTDQFGFYVGPYTAKQAKIGAIQLKHFKIDLTVV